jgi:hypothetical protein
MPAARPIALIILCLMGGFCIRRGRIVQTAQNPGVSGTIVGIVEPVSGEPSLCFRETGFCKAETEPPK